MKKKFEIYNESGIDENGYPIRTMVKSFKNEPEALAFYNNKRNIRRYGTMYMSKSADGASYNWDDRREEWVRS